MDDKAAFAIPLKFLNFAGLSPESRSKSANYRKVFFLSVCTFLQLSSLTELVTSFNKEALGSFIETFFVTFQNICKMIILIVYKGKVRLLLEDAEQFWDFDQFGRANGDKMREDHKGFKLFYRFFVINMNVATVLYSFMVIATGQPAILCYNRTKGLSVAEQRSYVTLNIIDFIGLTSAICGFDGMFFYLIAHVTSELKLIRVGFDDGNNHFPTQLKPIIEHHVFVLRFIRKMNNAFSLFLLFQHVCSVIGFCIAAVLMTIDGFPPDFEHVTKSGCYMIVYIVQLGMYCYAGNLIISESGQVSDGLIYDNWTNGRAYKYKTDKLIVLICGQRPAAISLGGFANLDLESFVLVIKNAMSVFTFVNAFRQIGS